MSAEKVLSYIIFCIVVEVLLTFGVKWSRKKGKIHHFHLISALLYKFVCFGIVFYTLNYLFSKSVTEGLLGILLLFTIPHAHAITGMLIALPVNGYRAYKFWKSMAYLRSLKKFINKQEKKDWKPEPYLSKSEKEWQERELEALKKRKQEGA